MNKWIRGLLQTAFAIVLVVLWLRTVSLGEVLSHATVHSWAAVVLMLALFLVTSLIRARRWLVLLRPLAPWARRLLPERVAAGLAVQAFAFRAGAKGLWPPALAGRLAGLPAIALLIDAFNFSLLFPAVGISVPTLKAMAACPALLLAFAVPAGPGYVGSLEVAGSLVLGGGLGLGSAVAAGAIVPYHAITPR